MAYTRPWRDFKRMQDVAFGAASLIYAGAVAHAFQVLPGGAAMVAATLGVVAAPFFVILAYAVAFDQMRESSLLADAMAGLRPAVAGLMLGVAYTMFMRSRKTKLGAGVSVAVAVLTLVCGVSAVTVILFGVIAGAGWFALEAWRRP